MFFFLIPMKHNPTKFGEFLTRIANFNPLPSDSKRKQMLDSLQQELEAKALAQVEQKVRQVYDEITNHVREIRILRHKERQLLTKIKEAEKKAEDILLGKDLEELA